jgi:hypothetical protein
LAFHKGHPFLHPEQGYKKERQVVIRSFEPALIEAAGTAHSGLVVENDGFGLYARNEETHGAIQDQDPLESCEPACLQPRRNLYGNLYR